jgi:hypothetical protein
MSEGVSQNITLDYQRQPVKRAMMPWWLRVGFALGAVPGVMCLWLPFYWRVSPWGVFADVWKNGLHGSYDLLMLLAGPFFLTLPIFVWKLRLAIAQGCRLWERVAIWALGTMAALATCVFPVRGIVLMSWNDLPIYVTPLVVMGLGIVALAWMRHVRARAESVATLTMYVPFLANGVLCLWGFCDHPDIGWYVTLGVCGIMLIEVVWTVIWETRNKAFI